MCACMCAGHVWSTDDPGRREQQAGSEAEDGGVDWSGTERLREGAKG